MKNQIRHLFIVCLLMSLIHESFAQTPKSNFREFTTSQGLSNNTVFALTQDDIGFLWIGTKSGLNRFDGYEFENFSLPESNGEETMNNTVFSLLKDHKNLIWIGQKDAGLVVYNPQKNKFTRFPFEANSIIDWNTITVRTIFEDSRHWLWIGTSGRGVIVLNEDRKLVKRFCNCNEVETKDRLSHDFIFEFEEDKLGNVYIATAGKGLNVYDRQTENIKQIHASDTEDMNSFGKTLRIDSLNTLWVGTQGNGLYALNLETVQWSVYRKNNSGISSDIVTDLELDGDGRLWIATDGGGLNEYDHDSQSFRDYKYDYRQSNSLNTDALYNLYFDTSDNLWIGTFNGGLNILNAIQSPFITNRNHYEEKKLDLRSVLAIQEDDKGDIWLGTDGGGIFYFKNYADSIVLHSAFNLVKEGQIDKVVTCIQPIPDKGFWYGTFANGLNFYNSVTKSVTKYKEDDINGLSNNNVWDLALDKKGGLWIGTLGDGLNYLPKGEELFTRYGNFSGQLSDVQVVDLQMQKDNKYLWIATESKGLNRLNLLTMEIKQYQHDPHRSTSLSSNNIYAISENNDGELWVVTDVAVDLFDVVTEDFSTLELDSDFKNKSINSLQSDNNGFVWFTTSAGIFRFDPSTSNITDFGQDPGIQNTIYNPKASLLTKNGDVIFGGVNGFSVITPGDVKPNIMLARPLLSDIRIEDYSVRSGSYNGYLIHDQNLNDEDLVIQLSYKFRDISFIIGTENLTNPLQNKFAYKLHGYDEDWTYVNDNQQTVTYTSLEGGEYTLMLKAANSSGIWHDEIKEIAIDVEPPFWKKTWFVIFAILCLGAVVFSVYRFLLNRQREMFELKSLEQDKAIMKQEQKILQLNNQNLEQEIGNKKAELNASILEMAHKNEFLTVLKTKIKKIQVDAESSAKRPLQSIANIIDSELRQEDYWDKFQHIFNQTFQDFIDQIAIKHPSLTPNENRISCFIRMKLTNKEIASILNITLNGVEQAKYRLKKKMDLRKEVNLNIYIQQFGKDPSPKS